MYFLDGDLENHDVSQLPKETLDVIEADSFWCMSKLLDGIQVCNATETFTASMSMTLIGTMTLIGSSGWSYAVSLPVS